jgi:hypothetical protein
MGVWVGGYEGTSSFVLENHGIGGYNSSSIGLLWGWIDYHEASATFLLEF